MKIFLLEIRMSDADAEALQDHTTTDLDSAEVARFVTDALVTDPTLGRWEPSDTFEITGQPELGPEPSWMDAVRTVGIGWPKRGGDPDDWAMQMAAIARRNGAECDFVMTAGTGPRGPIDLSAVLIRDGKRRYRVDIRPSRNTYKSRPAR